MTLLCYTMQTGYLNGCVLTILALTFHLQVCIGECYRSVLAKRSVVYVPEGDTISLWCDVQHCGQKDWTGGWGITTNGQFTYLFTSHRIHLSNQTMSAIKTRLVLNIYNVNQSDSGLYQCNIEWQNSTSTGHVTRINVTAGRNQQFTCRCKDAVSKYMCFGGDIWTFVSALIAAVSAGRITFYRLLVCAAASLCFPLIIGLACCFSSSDTSAPPVPPHPRITTSARVKPDTEVKYAVLVLNGRKHQNQAPAVEPTVYSTLNFSV